MSEFWTGPRASGKPASDWWPLYKRINVVATLIIVVLAIAATALGQQWPWLVAAGVVVLSLLLLGYWSLRGFPHEKAEIAAGYTTLPNRHQELPQVNADDWRIVRPAGAPFPAGTAKDGPTPAD